MKDSYQFSSHLILRTPTRPFTLTIDEATIRASLDDARFMEAVYLASPALHAECRKWQQGELTDLRKVEKLRSTLTRYYLRTTSRCTPFGLFAGCAVVEWGEHSRIELDPARSTRHTRLDMHYLCALAQHLAGQPAIRSRLRYWPNTSLYQTGEEIRYVEYHYANGVRVHQISAAAASPYLLQVLAAAQAGLPYGQLVDLLAETEADRAEAAEFIDELIENQLLVNELEPTVTGEEFFYHLLRVLTRLAAAGSEPEVLAAVRALEAVHTQLQALDLSPENPPGRYEQIVALLTPLGVPVEAGKLFQTDTILGVSPPAPTLQTTVQEELAEALEILQYLTPPPHSSRLEDFRARFQARYEEQEVPLLEALDNESGLSYTHYGRSTYSPLVADLVVGGTELPPRPPAPTAVQRLLHQKLQQAERSSQYAIAVTLAELRALVPPLLPPLPPSVGVMFRLCGAGQILLESVGGSSAVNLLGRFAHADPAIGQLVQQVTQREQAQNPAVAFAEICHLPASRTGNILLRPSFRALEIPYLAQSVRPESEQMRVQDLLLSVRDGRLVLRSRRTRQVIIPRLSTAHNFTHEALPVYQLLCDLQTQDVLAGLGFSWSAVAPYAKFLPRLTYRRVILKPASWQLEQADLQPLLSAAPEEFSSRFQQFRQQWQLPRLFTLADGDHELLVDSDNELLVRVWVETIRPRSMVRLKEFLLDAATSPVHDAAGRPYAHQFIALLERRTPCYPGSRAVPPPAAVTREFSLGSEWLYYKIYCGQKVADRVLLDALRPLTRELHRQGLIDRWFFIRYADPDNHLRVRFHLAAPERIGEVVQLVREYLLPFQASGTVWKLQTDTYRRELERYGPQAIHLAEALFAYQSAAALEMLAEAAEQAPALPGQEPAGWLWGLGAIEELLRALDYPLAAKVELLRQVKESFAREFGGGKGLKLQLDAKYRQARPAIQAVLGGAGQAPLPAPLLVIARQINTLEEQGRLEVSKPALLASYLHMLLNRLIPADARLHELVLYDFLYRHYQSQQALAQKMVV